jgi:hypothetical protein
MGIMGHATPTRPNPATPALQRLGREQPERYDQSRLSRLIDAIPAQVGLQRDEILRGRDRRGCWPRLRRGPTTIRFSGLRRYVGEQLSN